MNVKFISITSAANMTAEELVVYCARVSNPNNQNNHATGGALLQYCVTQTRPHWSIFEMIDLTVEIETSVAIATQMLRHKSFSFQQFSARYSKVNTNNPFQRIELRKQAETNRQSSSEIIADDAIERAIRHYQIVGFKLYNDLIDNGVAREVARFVLPQNTTTRLYMKGSIRSWIHYLLVRLDEHTQKEHRQVAERIFEIINEKLPLVGELIGRELMVNKHANTKFEELKSAVFELLSENADHPSNVELDFLMDSRANETIKMPSVIRCDEIIEKLKEIGIEYEN